MNKLFNKVLAVVLAGTMVVGASVTAFADDINGATGAGESTGHLDTSVVTAVLPTASVDSTFAFTVDPENIIAKAGKIKGGDTAVTANTDLVYFANVGEDATTYSSTSDKVPVGAQNYEAADVSVKAEIGEAASGKTLIPLLAAAPEAGATVSEPSLLLTLKVGSQTGVITADGVTVTDQIAAQAAKFDVVYDSTAKKYKLQAKTKDASDNDITWDKVDVQMSGKVYGGGTTTDTVVAPTVTLTWTVKAHVNGPSVAMTTAGVITVSNLTAAKNYANTSSAINLRFDGADNYLGSDANVTWDVENWSSTTGGTIVVTLNNAWKTALAGKKAEVIIKLSDDTTITTGEVQF